MLKTKVALFVPCLVDQAAVQTAWATVQILERLGIHLTYDSRQTCCGQAMFNAGYLNNARGSAEKFIRLFHDAEYIIAPSGSCVSMVKHRYADLDLSGSFLRDWESLRLRIFELTEFLVDNLGVDDIGSKFPFKVGIHNSCHALRELGIKAQPLKLLQNVEGLTLVNEDLIDECCGFGGVFSAKYPELSAKMGKHRSQQLEIDSPEFITGVDDSCLMHLKQAFMTNGALPGKTIPQTIHIARILASTSSSPFDSESYSYGGEV